MADSTYVEQYPAREDVAVPAQPSVARGDAAFRAVFECSLDGMLLIDDSGRYIDANSAACELFGRSRAELLRLSVFDIAPHHIDVARAAWRGFLAIGTGRRVWQLSRPDGDARWIDSASRANIVPGCHLAVLRDVTSERRATEKVRQSEEFHAKLFRSSPVAMAIASTPEGRFLDVNDAGLALVGRSRDEVLGRTGLELGLWANDEDRARIRAEITGDPDARDLAMQLRRGPDDVRDLLVSTSEIELDGERCFLYVATDITAVRLAERRLATSETRFRRLLETAVIGIGMTDGRRTLTFANAALASMLGATVAELVGRPFLELVAPHARTAAEAVHDRPIGGSGESHDLVLLRKDGTSFIAEVTATPLYDEDGNLESVLGTLTDVTTRRQAEAVRARLAAIVQSSCDAISSCALDGRIETWNPAAEQLFGYSAGEAIGQSLDLIVPPQQLDSFHQSMARVLGGEVVALEATRRRKDGTFLDVSITRSPVLDRTGTVVGISTVTRDITAQKRLEASLRETEAQLQHLQRMEAIGALAGGIAHDFNNLLSVILTSATLIDEALERNDPMREDAKTIREATERAATLTRQLLAFSRRQVLEPRVVNLGRVMTAMEKILRRLLGESISLVTSATGAGNALIDISQFEQVILNLAVNARDAMPDGGTLTIECDNIRLDERRALGTGVAPGEFVRIRVTDTGTGIDEATRQRLFEPFFTTKPRGKGTGLGLATVFGIVRQSGGFIRVDTEIGRGTTFEVYVPRTDQQARTVSVTDAPLTDAGRGETILVVEDEDAVRRLMQRLLRRQGYEVLTAANAGEALLLCEQRREIALVLTDVVMPIMNGRQLAERLRSMYPRLCIAYMSGYHEDEQLREMAGDEDVVYLQKPIQRDALMRKLRELLDRRAS